MCFVGHHYFISKDYAQAKHWWLKAVEAGNSDAAYQIVSHDRTVELGCKRIVELLFFSVIKKHKDVGEQLSLYFPHSYSRGAFLCTTEKYYTLLRDVLDAAAAASSNEYEQDQDRAMMTCYWIFGDYLTDVSIEECEECGRIHGFENEDVVKAQKYLRRAAEVGCGWPCYSLGSLLDPTVDYKSVLITKNLLEAIKWYKMAAERGCDCRQDITICCEGIKHLEKKDHPLVDELIDKFPETFEPLVCLRFPSDSDPNDFKNKEAYCRKYVERGNPWAMAFLGCFLLSEKGEDEEFAIRCLHQSSTLGVQYAKLKLQQLEPDDIFSFMDKGVDIDLLFYYHTNSLIIARELVSAIRRSMHNDESRWRLVRRLVYDYGINVMEQGLNSMEVQEFISDLVIVYQDVLNLLFTSRDLTRVVCNYLPWFASILVPNLQKHKKRRFEIAGIAVKDNNDIKFGRSTSYV